MGNYVQHLTGMALLLGWLARWERLGQTLRFRGPILRLADLPSQRIALGWPKRMDSKSSPFLGFQREEREWMERLQWERAVLVQEEQRVYLVARPQRVDAGDAVDIPAFAIGIALDHPSKFNLLASYGALEARSVWHDDQEKPGTWHVDRGSVMWRIPLDIHETTDGLLRTRDLEQQRDFLDLVRARIERTNYLFDPGFRGQPLAVPEEFRDLVDPFDATKMPK